MGELELAGFHLLSHVGGEVIRESKRGVKLLGLKATERVGTAAVGKATGDPQEPETRQPGGTGGPGGPGGPRRAEEGRGGQRRALQCFVNSAAAETTGSGPWRAPGLRLDQISNPWTRVGDPCRHR